VELREGSIHGCALPFRNSKEFAADVGAVGAGRAEPANGQPVWDAGR